MRRPKRPKKPTMPRRPRRGAPKASARDLAEEEKEAEQAEQEIEQEEKLEKDVEKKEAEKVKLTKTQIKNLKDYKKIMVKVRKDLNKGNAGAAFKKCANAMRFLTAIFRFEKLKLKDTHLEELDIKREETLNQMEEALTFRLRKGK